MSHELDDAAAAALLRLQTQPKEHMGALYRGKDGGIVESNTITSASNETVRGKLQILGALAALFHNHPAQPGRRDTHARQFSPDDLAQARRLKVPSYITTADGTIRRFDPRRNTTEEVLAQFPIEEYLQFIARQNPMTRAYLEARARETDRPRQ